MKRSTSLYLAACLGLCAASSLAAGPAPADRAALTREIEANDSALFEAFNRCADPVQLQAHAEFFSEDTEFYHDNSGVTWTRADMLANTAKYACGRYTRRLVPGTLKVVPIQGFGAIAEGRHLFCDMRGEACQGEADFVMVWRHSGDRWVVTRTLSFGHRPAARVGPTTTRLDMPAVQGLLSTHRVESISLALLRDGHLVASHAVGQARQGVPATVATLYNVASLAKPLTAEVALQLAGQGVISLDENMSVAWRDPDLGQDSRADQLTPALALSHRTGFPNWRQGALRFERAPGAAFGYSGEGFEYLARFIEAKTSTRLDVWAERLVFGPLGMRHTSYTRQPWFADRVALPHDDQGRAMPPDIRDQPIASDDVFSTPTDYAIFIESLMQADHSRLRQLQRTVITDRRAELCKALPPTACPSEAGFGLGWESFLIEGRRYLMHTGSDKGTFTFAYFSPDTRSGAVFFMNSGHGADVVLPLLRMSGADPAFIDFLDRWVSSSASK